MNHMLAKPRPGCKSRLYARYEDAQRHTPITISQSFWRLAKTYGASRERLKTLSSEQGVSTL